MLNQKFLQKVISEILEKSSDLSGFSFIIPGKRPVVFIKEILKEKCAENNIGFTEYPVPVNSVTVPYIEDAPNKFILRQSYDTTALVDETY